MIFGDPRTPLHHPRSLWSQGATAVAETQIFLGPATDLTDSTHAHRWHPETAGRTQKCLSLHLHVSLQALTLVPLGKGYIFPQCFSCSLHPKGPTRCGQAWHCPAVSYRLPHPSHKQYLGKDTNDGDAKKQPMTAVSVCRVVLTAVRGSPAHLPGVSPGPGSAPTGSPHLLPSSPQERGSLPRSRTCGLQHAASSHRSRRAGRGEAERDGAPGGAGASSFRSHMGRRVTACSQHQFCPPGHILGKGRRAQGAFTPLPLPAPHHPGCLHKAYFSAQRD